MTMILAETLPIRCDCGYIRAHADLRGHHVQRAVCYCRDCRMFAYFLARADTMLDQQGGTEVVQMSQGRLHFQSGQERLACMRLTPDGILRWYAACCDTPIGNIPPNRHLPYLSLIHACIDYAATGHTAESLLGRVGWHVNARELSVSPRGHPGAARTHDGIPFALLARVAFRVIGWRLRGDHRRSPFFDTHSGRPVARPHVLSARERTALEARMS